MNYLLFPGLPDHAQKDYRDNIGKLTKKLPVTLILNFICRHYNTTFEELSSKTRTHKTHVFPRRMFYYLCKKYGHENRLKEIGLILKQDHATVLNSIKKYNNLMQSPYDPITIEFKEIEKKFIKTFGN